MSKKICMVLVFLLTMAGMLSAQTRTVKGNVVFYEDGQPAIGAYVSVESPMSTEISRLLEFQQVRNSLL